jgi:hypothetical protein
METGTLEYWNAGRAKVQELQKRQMRRQPDTGARGNTKIAEGWNAVVSSFIIHPSSFLPPS